MINFNNLCPNCMKDAGGETVCPHCGYRSDTPQLPLYLSVGTVVAHRYYVGRCVEGGGDGATYCAWDLNKNTPVMLREFLPEKIASRNTKTKCVFPLQDSRELYDACEKAFIELWGKLMRISGQLATINVIDTADDYSTHYAVYERLDGVTLRDYLINNVQGFLPWERARQLLMPLLSTLGTLHNAGIIHRGICPTNLIVGKDGKIKLTGFCIGQARTSNGCLSEKLYDGYSAIEQYDYNSRQGTWTDIYAFGAVLYRTLIGSEPLSAPSRFNNDRLMIPARFAEQLPAYVINGLVNALQIIPEDRTKNVEQLRAELSASPSAMIADDSIGGSRIEGTGAVINDYTRENAPAKRKKNKSFTVLKTTVICLLIGILAIFVVSFVLPEKYDDYNIVRQFIRQATGSEFAFHGFKDEDETQIQTKDVSVPELVGKSMDEVKGNTYYSTNFNVVFNNEYNETVEEGYIVSQDLTAGATVPQGTTLTLVVSKGMPYITMPAVVGMQLEDAKKLLTETGFTISRDDISYKTNDGAHTAGIVFKVDKNVGSSYRKGSPVSLVVWAEESETTSGISGSIQTAPDTTAAATTASQETTTVPTSSQTTTTSSALAAWRRPNE